MEQAKRITPEYPFPEVEPHGLHAYGTAWPLSEDFYLCNFNFGLYLLDRFGNRVVIGLAVTQQTDGQTASGPPTTRSR